MGNIFSGSNSTPTALDSTNFVSKDYVTSQLANYSKTSDLNSQVSSQLSTQLQTQLPIQLSNYAKYSNDKKSLNLNVNSDTDYFTLNDLNNKQLAKFGKNTIIDNFNSKQITVDNTNQIGIVLKNSSGNQQNTFAIQNGNDGNGATDFIRIGQVTLKPDGSMDTQTPFIRMDRNTTTQEMNTKIRSNVIFNKDINIGADTDNKYYNISRDDNMCLSLKYKDTSITPNKNIQIGKWCPPPNTI